MNKVKIKTEFPPNRCEICHKADCFDLSTLSCKRCKGLQVYDKQQNNYKFDLQEKENYFRILNDKEYGWKGYSNEVNKKFGIACGITLINLFSFTIILLLETIILDSKNLYWLKLTYPSSISLCLYLVIVALEFTVSKLLANKNRFVIEGIKFGSILTLGVIAILFIIFTLYESFRYRSPL